MKLLTAFILLISMGCIPMAYQETLRPNGDSTPLEWTSTGANHFDQVIQEVGDVGAIPRIDTTRIGALNGNIHSLIRDADETFTWSDWTGPSESRIKGLKFRAVVGSSSSTISEVSLTVYINGDSVGVTAFRAFTSPNNYAFAQEGEIELSSYATATQINTLETKLTIVNEGTGSFFVYALECLATTTEKEMPGEPDRTCKTISESITLEKKI